MNPHQDTIEPVEIRAPRGARRMEIDWSDGQLSAIPHTILRGFCPCAHCQGHEGPVRFVEVDEDSGLELRDLAEVGRYAIRLEWGDGHTTGIYTFKHLRRLGELAERTAEELPGTTLPR